MHGKPSDSVEDLRAHSPQIDEGMLQWWSRDTSNKSTEGDGDKAKRQRNAPFITRNMSNMECCTTNKHNEDLTSNSNEGDRNEISVLGDTLKDVEFVVKSPTIDQVEDLGEDIGIEH